MKALYFLVLALSISQYNSLANETLCDCVEVESKEKCKEFQLLPGAVFCCFVEREWNTGEETKISKMCASVTQERFDHLDAYIESRKQELIDEGYTVIRYNVECGYNSSKYIFNSIILLLLSLIL